MTAIETTAIAQDETHLILQQPLARKPIGPVKVILMIEDEAPRSRQLGHLEGIVSCRIGADFSMSDAELLRS